MFESILIVNQDNFDYKDLRIEINNEFTLNRPIIKKGETTLVDVFGFVDKHGNRFNPSAKKLMNISIYCHLDNDQVGWFYGTFK